jgi:hypothetical protein
MDDNMDENTTRGSNFDCLNPTEPGPSPRNLPSVSAFHMSPECSPTVLRRGLAHGAMLVRPEAMGDALSQPKSSDTSPRSVREAGECLPAVRPGMQVVQVDASDDVWGELERLLYGVDNERSTPPSSPYGEAIREAPVLGNSLGNVPFLRLDTPRAGPDVDAASSPPSVKDTSVLAQLVAEGMRQNGMAPDGSGGVLELTLEKTISGTAAFSLLSHAEGGDQPQPQQRPNGASKPDKGAGKRRGFIIMDLESSPERQQERRQSFACAPTDILPFQIDDFSENLPSTILAFGTDDARAGASMYQQSADSVPTWAQFDESCDFPETPPGGHVPIGGNGGAWDKFGGSQDLNMDDKASVASIASTAEVGDHGASLSSAIPAPSAPTSTAAAAHTSPILPAAPRTTATTPPTTTSSPGAAMAVVNVELAPTFTPAPHTPAAALPAAQKVDSARAAIRPLLPPHSPIPHAVAAAGGNICVLCNIERACNM